MSRVAIVTGATGGIGGALAAALAAEGAEVHGLARQAGAAGIAWHPVDFGDEAGTERCAAALAAALPDLDVLVHSAGAFATGTVGDAPLADLDRMWRTNLRAPWVLTRALLPALRRRQGWVVFVNSSVWDNARGRIGGYAASKYALKAMADALRAEVNDDGVRVLGVYPGRTASRMQEAIFAEEGQPYRPETLLQPEDVAQAVIGAMALPRRAEITDLHLRPARKGA